VREPPVIDQYRNQRGVSEPCQPDPHQDRSQSSSEKIWRPCSEHADLRGRSTFEHLGISPELVLWRPVKITRSDQTQPVGPWCPSQRCAPPWSSLDGSSPEMKQVRSKRMP